MSEHQTFMDAASINVENDSLRAKLQIILKIVLDKGYF